MTTPPPPPPPGQPDWPASQPSMAASAGTSAPQTWWTGGRIAIAIVVVLLLMGGAGFAGFLAGVAVGGTQSIMDDFEQLDGFDQEFDGAFDNDVPGIMPLDTPSTAGSAIRPGGTTEGFYGGSPVDHPLTVADGGQVTIEVVSDDFDTVLVLLDADGELVASDDDGAGNTNSRIRTDLTSGEYTVRVQPWSDFEDGGYTLSVD